MINGCKNIRKNNDNDQQLQKHKKQAMMMISRYMNIRKNNDHGEKHKKK